MFCQEASGLWGLERVQRLFFALPGLLDGSWASPGAPSCALGPLWACLACRPVLFGRLLDALGRPTGPLNCQTAVRKPCQVAPSACQALPQACRTFKKPRKTLYCRQISGFWLFCCANALGLLLCSSCALLGCLLGLTCRLLGASWGQLGANLDALGPNLDALGAKLGALGANLDALGANLRPTWTLLGPTWTH